jgi:hypothetical protein
MNPTPRLDRHAARAPTKEGTRKQPIRAALEPLISRGLIAPPTQELVRHGLKPLEVPGKPVSEMVIEDRR